MIRLKGLRRAVARYKKLNTAPWILDCIMLDRRNGKLWCDKSYIDNDAIINLVDEMKNRNNGDFSVDISSVKSAAEMLCLEYTEN